MQLYISSKMVKIY